MLAFGLIDLALSCAGCLSSGEFRGATVSLSGRSHLNQPSPPPALEFFGSSSELFSELWDGDTDVPFRTQNSTTVFSWHFDQLGACIDSLLQL